MKVKNSSHSQRSNPPESRHRQQRSKETCHPLSSSTLKEIKAIIQKKLAFASLKQLHAKSFTKISKKRSSIRATKKIKFDFVPLFPSKNSITYKAVILER